MYECFEYITNRRVQYETVASCVAVLSPQGNMFAPISHVRYIIVTKMRLSRWEKSSKRVETCYKFLDRGTKLN